MEEQYNDKIYTDQHSVEAASTPKHLESIIRQTREGQSVKKQCRYITVLQSKASFSAL